MNSKYILINSFLNESIDVNSGHIFSLISKFYKTKDIRALASTRNIVEKLTSIDVVIKNLKPADKTEIRKSEIQFTKYTNSRNFQAALALLAFSNSKSNKTLVSKETKEIEKELQKNNVKPTRNFFENGSTILDIVSSIVSTVGTPILGLTIVLFLIYAVTHLKFLDKAGVEEVPEKKKEKSLPPQQKPKEKPGSSEPFII